MKLTSESSPEGITLRSTMNRILLVMFALVTVFTVSALFGYAQIKQSLSTRSMIEDLIKGTPSQIQGMIPSLLVPEQRSGIEVLLKRFKNADGLERIALLETLNEKPAGFSRCENSDSFQICFSQDGKDIAVIAPIIESGQNYGFLMKSKKISNPLANDVLLPMIEVAGLVVVFVFLFLFLISSRITSREIPGELDKLAHWVEDVLADKTSTQAPKFRFRELNDLGSKIAEILESHEKSREQAVIGQLTSGIMHDLKTPLHPIFTAFGLAKEKAVDSPKRLERLENLFKACSINLPIIGNLIETTLDGNRDIHIEPVRTDLRSTIEAAASLHSESLNRRKFELELTLGESAVWVNHDPGQLGRVFSNLLKNGIEAIDEARKSSPTHPAGLRVSITHSEPHQVRVTLEDSGVGLPRNPEKVFRVFRSSKLRGSGLGLLISQKIVHAHGGQITASHSEALAGARFDILLARDSSEQPKEVFA